MHGPDDSDTEADAIDFDPDFLRTRREAWWIGATWATCLLWTLGYGAFFGYNLDADEVTTTFGMPSWIFWGVALPWLLAALFSIGFALFVIRDHALEEVAGESEAENTEDGDG